MCLCVCVCVCQVYYWRERSLHGEQEGAGKQQQVLSFSGNRSEGRLPGLQPYSLYGLSIRVLNGKGEGPASTNHTFETPEGGAYGTGSQA